MGRKVVRDARAERLSVTRIGAVKGAQPEATSPPSLKERLVEARALSAQLNEGMDRLNEGLREVQSLIGALRLGVSAAVELPNGKTLAYGRLGPEWCLHIKDTKTPILKASREDHLAATGAIGALVDALSENAARMTADVKAVTADLEGLCKDIVDSVREGGAE
jgi:hypothetical protein